MGAQASVREFKEYPKFVGFFEGEVISINPDLEELNKLLGEDSDLEKEPEYTKEVEVEDKEGNKSMIKQAIISVWVRDVKTKKAFNIRFFLKDRERQNKGGDKWQYINSQGNSTWADSVENLADWFTKTGEYRKAKDGEAELLEFVRNWLNKIDFEKDFKIEYDFSRLINGNVKELRQDMKSSLAGTILCLATVRKGEDSMGDVKYYQQVYNKAFGGGYLIKNVRLSKLDGEFIGKLLEAKREKKKLKTFQKLILNIVDEEYGVQDFYKLTELEEYNKDEDYAATGEAKKTDPVDSSY